MHIWKDFPRNEIYYGPSIIALGEFAQQLSLEEIILVLFSCLPTDECKILPKPIGPILEDFSFSSFMKRAGAVNYGRTYDIAVCFFFFT